MAASNGQFHEQIRHDGYHESGRGGRAPLSCRIGRTIVGLRGTRGFATPDLTGQVAFLDGYNDLVGASRARVGGIIWTPSCGACRSGAGPFDYLAWTDPRVRTASHPLRQGAA
jgi:hypothetical protein